LRDSAASVSAALRIVALAISAVFEGFDWQPFT
jgi:hypothetical protein